MSFILIIELFDNILLCAQGKCTVGLACVTLAPALAVTEINFLLVILSFPFSLCVDPCKGHIFSTNGLLPGIDHCRGKEVRHNLIQKQKFLWTEHETKGQQGNTFEIYVT